MQASQPEKAEGVPIELLDLAQKRFMQWYQERETERADKSRAIQAENLSGMPPMIGNPQIAKDRLLDSKTEVDLKTTAEYLGKSLPHVRRLTQQGTLAVTKSTRPKMLSVHIGAQVFAAWSIESPRRKCVRPNAHNSHLAYFTICAVWVKI